MTLKSLNLYPTDMKLILLAIINFSLILPAYSQRSENIDTLSRKEIRKLILNQQDSKKAKKLMGLHQGTKALSILGYTVGAISLLSGSSPSNSQEVNIQGLMGGVLIGSALLFTIISETTYFNSVKEYKASSITTSPTSKVYLRNSSNIYYSIRE